MRGAAIRPESGPRPRSFGRVLARIVFVLIVLLLVFVVFGSRGMRPPADRGGAAGQASEVPASPR